MVSVPSSAKRLIGAAALLLFTCVGIVVAVAGKTALDVMNRAKHETSAQTAPDRLPVGGKANAEPGSQDAAKPAPDQRQVEQARPLAPQVPDHPAPRQVALAPAPAPEAAQPADAQAPRPDDPEQMPAERQVAGPKSARQVVLEYCKKYANDPSSVEVVEWGDPVSCRGDYAGHQCDTAIYVVVRARNKLGALTVEPTLFFLSDEEITNYICRASDEQVFDSIKASIYGQEYRDPLGEFAKGMAERGRRFLPGRR